VTARERCALLDGTQQSGFRRRTWRCSVHAEANFVAMSFDTFVQPCRYAETAAIEGSQSESLTAAEERAVRSILARVCPGGPDEHHCWVVNIGDGGRAEVFGKDLRKGCMFALRGLTPDLVQLMFDILVAGNWVLLPAQESRARSPPRYHAIRRVPQGRRPEIVRRSLDGGMRPNAHGVRAANGDKAPRAVRRSRRPTIEASTIPGRAAPRGMD
jgi:hypothetical protein